MAYPLEVNQLTKDYNSFRAVDHVSFSLEEGQIYGLLGPNGAGKTSIINTITSLQTPTSGSVTVFGHQVKPESQYYKSLIGFVPQEIVHHGFFTVEEVLRFHSGYYGIWRNEECISDLLERLQLSPHRGKLVKQLSGGMKRRLLIAKALVHSPKLLLLDEPTAGVDVELRLSLWNLIRELKKQGTSILLTTHYLEEAEQLCDVVGFLNKGKLHEQGTTQQLVKMLTTREVILHVNKPQKPCKHPQLVSQNDERLTFKIPSSEPLGRLINQLEVPVIDIGDIKIREGRLEDVFQTIMGNNHA